MNNARHEWRLVPGQLLHRREWDDEVVLFNDLSSATHLLSPVALWMLDTLQAGSAAEGNLYRALAHELGPDEAIDDDEFAALLKGLAGLYLIEPC